MGAEWMDHKFDGDSLTYSNYYQSSHVKSAKVQVNPYPQQSGGGDTINLGDSRELLFIIIVIVVNVQTDRQEETG